MVIEAMAQAGGILTNHLRGGYDREATSYLVKVDAAKFSRMVVPGDRLELEVEVRRVIRKMTFYSGVARVDGKEVACAEIPARIAGEITGAGLIHPTAVIDPSARLGEGVSVGAFSLVGADVEIGDGTRIGPHCSITGPTRIGRDNRIVGHAAIGGEPQDKFRGERVGLVTATAT